jgi:hypothetical protein
MAVKQRMSWAELEALVKARGCSIVSDHRGAKEPRDLHEGKPVSAMVDPDTGAVEILRWDIEGEATVIGRIVDGR